jgi:hypothetical protein
MEKPLFVLSEKGKIIKKVKRRKRTDENTPLG